jgi:RNA polymerase sigma-70 factor (ECF subfamily)
MEEAEVQRRVRAALEGEPERFSPVVEAYTPALFNLAVKMTGSREQAEEIVQETFFRAYRNLGKFDGSSRFVSWLCGIAVNVCRDAGKRSRRTATAPNLDELPAEPAAGGAEPADDRLVSMQEEERVRRCLIRLPETLRSALLLRYQEDLSLAEVATILRIGLSATKMRVQRGLNRLKRCLEGQVEAGA